MELEHSVPPLSLNNRIELHAQPAKIEPKLIHKEAQPNAFLEVIELTFRGNEPHSPNLILMFSAVNIYMQFINCFCYFYSFIYNQLLLS